MISYMRILLGLIFFFIVASLGLYFPDYSQVDRYYSDLLPNVINAQAKKVDWVDCPNQEDYTTKCQLITITHNDKSSQILRYDIPENERPVKAGETVQVVHNDDGTYNWYGASSDRILIILAAALLAALLILSWRKALVLFVIVSFTILYFIPAFLTHEGSIILIAIGSLALSCLQTQLRNIPAYERFFYLFVHTISIIVSTSIAFILIYFAQPNGALWIEHIPYLETSHARLILFATCFISQYYIAQISIKVIQDKWNKHYLFEHIQTLLYVMLGTSITTLFMVISYRQKIAFDPVFVHLSIIFGSVLCTILVSSAVAVAIKAVLPRQALSENQLSTEHLAETTPETQTDSSLGHQLD